MEEWIKLYDKTRKMKPGDFVTYDTVNKIIKGSRTAGTYNREINKWKHQMIEGRRLEPVVRANLGYRLVKIRKGDE